MTVMQGFWLGILQGISEFLPISSSGHLLLLQRIFGIESNIFSLTVVVHVGSLIPVLVIYFSRLKDLLFRPFQKMTLLLIAGTLPMVLAVLLLDDLIDVLFGGAFLGVGFLITGICMLLVDRAETDDKTEVDMTPRDAALIGLVQAVAMVPGISRSGSTIFGGITRGLDRKTAANFSFLLSIPAIVGATVWEVISQLRGGEAIDTAFFFSAPVVVAFFASMIAGFFAIKVMLRLIVAAKMKYFSYYLFVLAGLIVFDQLVSHRFF